MSADQPNDALEEAPAASDGWRRIYVVLHHVVEVHVPDDAYEDTTDADDDSELYEFLGNGPLDLVEFDGMDVVRDARLAAAYAEQGVQWKLDVTRVQPSRQSTSPVLPAREETS